MVQYPVEPMHVPQNERLENPGKLLTRPRSSGTHLQLHCVIKNGVCAVLSSQALVEDEETDEPELRQEKTERFPWIPLKGGALLSRPRSKHWISRYQTASK